MDRRRFLAAGAAAAAGLACGARTGAGATPMPPVQPPPPPPPVEPPIASAADDSDLLAAKFANEDPVRLDAREYRISRPMQLSGWGRAVRGAGAERSRIVLTGAHRGIELVDQYARVSLADFAVVGAPGTGDAICLGEGEQLGYDTELRSLFLETGGRGVYGPRAFSVTLANVYGSSHGADFIDLWGGPGTLLEQCYAKNIPAGRYGFRIYGGATLIACNGVDLGGGRWGLFGGEVARGDRQDAQYRVELIGCNIEDFGDVGLVFRFDGHAGLTSCTFVTRRSGTYRCSVLVENSQQGIAFERTRLLSQGAVRTALAEVVEEHPSRIEAHWSPEFATVEHAGTVRSL